MNECPITSRLLADPRAAVIRHHRGNAEAAEDAAERMATEAARKCQTADEVERLSAKYPNDAEFFAALEKRGLLAPVLDAHAREIVEAEAEAEQHDAEAAAEPLTSAGFDVVASRAGHEGTYHTVLIPWPEDRPRRRNRADVARQLEELLWASLDDDDDEEPVTVHRTAVIVSIEEARRAQAP